MIKQINLENFRGFEKFQSPLTPITIFGGKNNSGKTSILEAILFLYSHGDPNCFFQMNFFRHINDQPLFTAERLWESLFYKFNTNNALRILLQNDNKEDNDLILERDKNTADESGVLNNIRNNFMQNTGFVPGNYPLKFQYKSSNVKEYGIYVIENNAVSIKFFDKKEKQNITPQMVLLFKSETIFDNNMLAQWFGNLVLNEKKDLFVKALKIFDENIVDVQTIMKGYIGYLYVSFADGRKMPASYMGDGMNRMLNILLGILSNPGSIILIDEIENGFHYSMYQKLWEMIGLAAIKNNCQLIVNTHSKDLIQGAIDGLREIGHLEKLSYNRLAKIDDKIEAKVFDSNLIEYALDSEMEVR